MSQLTNKNVLVAVTGGIAAYKTPELVRRLKDEKANVRVVMTDGAKSFITPMTLQAVSGNPVSDSLLDEAAEAAMGHIELAKWADLIVIAPATADVIAKIRIGLANDLLSTICLATAAPVAIAPAMNQQMWRAAATQENISVLATRGFLIWGPAKGEQACGDVGPGRMLEPLELLSQIHGYFSTLSPNDLVGQHWVITAGPTREAIDPVRYISNHSSGKMGYAIAQSAKARGAKVSLITGPVDIPPPADIDTIQVTSAKQMHKKALELGANADVFVGCAAVADYGVHSPSNEKIKKQTNQDELTLTLVKNPDIIADVAQLKNKPFMVGFAAETQNVAAYAQDKLDRKNLDMIAANDVSNSAIGFNSDENALQVFTVNSAYSISQANKRHVAKQLVDLISKVKQNA